MSCKEGCVMKCRSVEVMKLEVIYDMECANSKILDCTACRACTAA
jgi:hypothetical protein